MRNIARATLSRSMLRGNPSNNIWVLSRKIPTPDQNTMPSAVCHGTLSCSTMVKAKKALANVKHIVAVGAGKGGHVRLRQRDVAARLVARGHVLEHLADAQIVDPDAAHI